MTRQRLLLPLHAIAGLLACGSGAFAQHEHHPGMQPGMTQTANPDSVTHSVTQPVTQRRKEALQRPAMTLDEFNKMALESNPILKEAEAIVRRSAAQAKQAGLYPNPSAGYEGEQIRGGSQGGGEQGGFVQQTIVLGGKLGARRNVYEQQRREDEIGASEQRARLLGGIGQQYYSTLAAQKTVEVRERMVKLTADAAETAHQLSNVGQADTPDVLQAEVESEQAQLDYETAQFTHVQEFAKLAALAGKPDLPLAPLAVDFENPPEIASGIVEEMLNGSPAVKRANQDIARAEAALKSAKRESVPDLSLRAGLQQNFEPLGAGPNLPVGLQGFATAGVTIPLFNRNQGNVEAARAEVDRAHAQAERTRLSIRHAAQPMLQMVLAEREQAMRYKNDMLPRADRAYQLYIAKYQEMGSPYLQVILSQRTLFQLQIGYVHILEDLWRNTVALQNFTLTGGLDAPMAAGSAATTLNLPNGGSGSIE